MKFEYKGNIKGIKPLIMNVPMTAGTSNTCERGDVLVLTTGNFVPLAADQAMAATIVVAEQKITAAHLAGYYPALVPQDGDLFQVDLAAASAAVRGASAYVTDATQKLALSGTNVIGNVFDTAGYPRKQGEADVGDVADRGTTVQSVTRVLITIKKAASYLAALQT